MRTNQSWKLFHCLFLQEKFCEILNLDRPENYPETELRWGIQDTSLSLLHVYREQWCQTGWGDIMIGILRKALFVWKSLIIWKSLFSTRYFNQRRIVIIFLHMCWFFSRFESIKSCKKVKSLGAYKISSRPTLLTWTGIASCFGSWYFQALVQK